MDQPFSEYIANVVDLGYRGPNAAFAATAEVEGNQVINLCALISKTLAGSLRLGDQVRIQVSRIAPDAPTQVTELATPGDAHERRAA